MEESVVAAAANLAIPTPAVHEREVCGIMLEEVGEGGNRPDGCRGLVITVLSCAWKCDIDRTSFASAASMNCHGD